MSPEASFSARIKGTRISEFIRMEYSFQNELVSEVSVLFAHLGEDSWIRFFFDAGVFFWREVIVPETPYIEGAHSYALHPIQLQCSGDDAIVQKVEFTGQEGTTKRSASLLLRAGCVLKLKNENDENSFSITIA